MAWVEGSGMIGSLLRERLCESDIFVYAAGPSDSAITDESAFYRDRTRLTAALDRCRGGGGHLFYFVSTTSAADSSSSPYARHKYQMERLVRSSKVEHIIIRLPQVSGMVLNKTFLSAFTQMAYQGLEIRVKRGTRRFLIDVEDLPNVIEEIQALGIKNQVVRSVPYFSVTPQEVISILAQEFGLQARFSFVDPSREEFDWSSRNIITPKMHEPSYPFSIIRKYVPFILRHMT